MYSRLSGLQEGLMPKKRAAASDDDMHRINELIQVRRTHLDTHSPGHTLPWTWTHTWTLPWTHTPLDTHTLLTHLKRQSLTSPPYKTHARTHARTP